MTIHKFTIETGEIGTRLDVVIARKLSISRNQAQKYLEENKVFLNQDFETDPAKKVKYGEFYRVIPEDKKIEKLEAYESRLNIIFEDEELLVINKPANLTVHPGAGNHQDTLANILVNYLGDRLSNIGGHSRPGILHRLDKDTSGAMIIAKNNESHLLISEQIKSRQVKRRYLAVSLGQVDPAQGRIEKNIARSKINFKRMAIYEEGGKIAITHYQVLKYYDNVASLVQFSLETGRTHQIRLHSASIGFPLVGDKLYGSKNSFFRNHLEDPRTKYLKEFPRQALHSEFLSFTHPKTLEVLEFRAEIPQDLQKLLSVLEKS